MTFLMEPRTPILLNYMCESLGKFGFVYKKDRQDLFIYLFIFKKEETKNGLPNYSDPKYFMRCFRWYPNI